MGDVSPHTPLDTVFELIEEAEHSVQLTVAWIEFNRLLVMLLCDAWVIVKLHPRIICFAGKNTSFQAAYASRARAHCPRLLEARRRLQSFFGELKTFLPFQVVTIHKQQPQRSMWFWAGRLKSFCFLKYILSVSPKLPLSIYRAQLTNQPYFTALQNNAFDRFSQPREFVGVRSRIEFVNHRLK